MLNLKWKILIFFLIFMSVFGLSAANAMELNKENGQKLILPDFDGVKNTENPSGINVMALG